MNNKPEQPDTSQKFVTMGWDGDPTIVISDGNVLPRKAELIIHSEYYPNWPDQKWPVDPKTGEKLPEDNPRSRAEVASRNAEQSAKECQEFIDKYHKRINHSLDADRYYFMDIDRRSLNYEPEGLGAVFWGIIIFIVVLLIITGIFFF